MPYALVGGLAYGHHSNPRTTKDVDFLLNPPQLVLPGLLEELIDHGFTLPLVPTIQEWTQHHMVNFRYQGCRVDWLKPVIPMYQHILEKAQVGTVLGLPMRVATAEGIILTKLLAFRPQDQVDIENLVIANRDNLDWPWIQEEWQAIESMDEPRMVWLRGLVEKHVKHA